MTGASVVAPSRDHARQLDCYVLLQNTHTTLSSPPPPQSPTNDYSNSPSDPKSPAQSPSQSTPATHARTLVLGAGFTTDGDANNHHPVPTNLAAIAAAFRVPHSPRRKLSSRLRSLARRARDVTRIRRSGQPRNNKNSANRDIVADEKLHSSPAHHPATFPSTGGSPAADPFSNPDSNPSFQIHRHSILRLPNHRHTVGNDDEEDEDDDEDDFFDDEVYDHPDHHHDASNDNRRTLYYWKQTTKDNPNAASWSSSPSAPASPMPPLTLDDHTHNAPQQPLANRSLLQPSIPVSGPDALHKSWLSDSKLSSASASPFPAQFGGWAQASHPPNTVAELPKLDKTHAGTVVRVVRLPRGVGIAPVRSPKPPNQSTSSITAASERSASASDAGTHNDANRRPSPTSSPSSNAPVSPVSELTASGEGDRDENNQDNDLWVLQQTSHMGAQTFKGLAGVGNIAEKIANAVVEISSEDEDSQLLQGVFTGRVPKQQPEVAESPAADSPVISLPEGLEAALVNKGNDANDRLGPHRADDEYEVDQRVQEVVLNAEEQASHCAGSPHSLSLPAVAAFRRRAVNWSGRPPSANAGQENTGFCRGLPPATVLDDDSSSTESMDRYKDARTLRPGRALSDSADMSMAEDDFISFLFDSSPSAGCGADAGGVGGVRSANRGLSVRLISGKSGQNRGVAATSEDVAYGLDMVNDQERQGGHHRLMWGLGGISLRGEGDARPASPSQRTTRQANRTSCVDGKAVVSEDEKEREDTRFSVPVRRAMARVKIMSYLT